MTNDKIPIGNMDLLPSKRAEGSYKEHAREIVTLVHEAEDADE